MQRSFPTPAKLFTHNRADVHAQRRSAHRVGSGRRKNKRAIPFEDSERGLTKFDFCPRQLPLEQGKFYKKNAMTLAGRASCVWWGKYSFLSPGYGTVISSQRTFREAWNATTSVTRGSVPGDSSGMGTASQPPCAGRSSRAARPHPPVLRTSNRSRVMRQVRRKPSMSPFDQLGGTFEQPDANVLIPYADYRRLLQAWWCRPRTSRNSERRPDAGRICRYS